MSSSAQGQSPALEESSELDRAYLARVMEEIEDDVSRRRSAGDLPAVVEHELDELFLRYSTVAGRGGNLRAVLRAVDAAAFVDPVVPIASSRAGGAAIKKSLRSLSFWYMSWITQQVSQFGSAVARALHLVDERLTAAEQRLDSQRVMPALVVEYPASHRLDAWWVPGVMDDLAGVPGRVLHAACGDGWLVRALAERGVDAYGVDPRPGKVDRAELEGVDLREEPILEHLRAVSHEGLGGIVLSGVVDGMTNGEREQLIELVTDRLAPGGRFVVHSLSPAGWASDDAPVEVDFASGHPYRAAVWERFLPFAGFETSVRKGPTSVDYLVSGVLRWAPDRKP